MQTPEQQQTISEHNWTAWDISVPVERYQYGQKCLYCKAQRLDTFDGFMYRVDKWGQWTYEQPQCIDRPAETTLSDTHNDNNNFGHLIMKPRRYGYTVHYHQNTYMEQNEIKTTETGGEKTPITPGKVISILREKIGMQQYELCQLAGIGEKNLELIELENHSITPEQLQALADAFKVDVKVLSAALITSDQFTPAGSKLFYELFPDWHEFATTQIAYNYKNQTKIDKKVKKLYRKHPVLPKQIRNKGNTDSKP